jgi:hypothetical protein
MLESGPPVLTIFTTKVASVWPAAVGGKTDFVIV